MLKFRERAVKSLLFFYMNNFGGVILTVYLSNAFHHSKDCTETHNSGVESGKLKHLEHWMAVKKHTDNKTNAAHTNVYHVTAVDTGDGELAQMLFAREDYMYWLKPLVNTESLKDMKQY